jgi:uncharacterized protein YcgI (DUF1989 family)
MNIPIHSDRTTLSFEPPTSKEGEYICLKAEVDLVVAFSACPQVSFFDLRMMLFDFDRSDMARRKRKREEVGRTMTDCNAQDILSINCGKPVDAHFEIS